MKKGNNSRTKSTAKQSRPSAAFMETLADTTDWDKEGYVPSNHMVDGKRLMVHYGTEFRQGVTEAEAELVEHAKAGRFAQVQQSIAERKAHVDCCNSAGVTPLIAASGNGHEAIVEYLLAQGADLSLKDKFGMTALHQACIRRRYTIAEMLISAGVNVSETTLVGARTALEYCRDDAGRQRLEEFANTMYVLK